TMLHRFTSYEMSTTLENGAVIEGGKTGFTDEAGQCLVSFAEYGGEEYILVTAEAMTDSGSAVDSIADASTVYGRLQ
ncbi:MAG: D-alanyl-D-alanine carboxypeptidase, partial [Fusicatenibacter sp.]|nr:D-alanyl-D-alanine carboxypeptidase [Fusicatenibacter sp.]